MCGSVAVAAIHDKAGAWARLVPAVKRNAYIRDLNCLRKTIRTENSIRVVHRRTICMEFLLWWQRDTQKLSCTPHMENWNSWLWLKFEMKKAKIDGDDDDGMMVRKCDCNHNFSGGSNTLYIYSIKNFQSWTGIHSIRIPFIEMNQLEILDRCMLLLLNRISVKIKWHKTQICCSTWNVIYIWKCVKSFLTGSPMPWNVSCTLTRSLSL